MSYFEENRRILQRQHEDVYGVRAVTGRLQSDGRTYGNPSESGQPNKIWVTRKDNRQEQLVWNNGRFIVNKRFSGTPVRIGRNDVGEWELIGGDTQDADTFHGSASSTALSAQPNLNLAGAPITLVNLTELKPYLDPLGGLLIRALPGWLPDGKYWLDDAAYDMTSDVTATTGYSAYVVVGVDLDTDTWVAETTTDRIALTTWPSLAADVEAVLQSAAWLNVYPIAAVPLTDGDTTFANGDIINLRALSGSSGAAPSSAKYIVQTASSDLSAEQALSSLQTGEVQVTTTTGVLSSLKSNLGATAAPGTGNDNTQNYSIGSLWIDTTNDRIYRAVDVSTGAAVWKELSLPDVVSATRLVGGQQDAVVVISGDGAITIAPGTVALTKGSAAAITLAAPTAGTHDGYILRVYSESAFAHVITSGVDGFNAKGASGTAAFAAALGNALTLVARNGHWWTLSLNGVTIA